MIGIATARPVAQRHGGGSATLARMDLAAEFRGDQAQVEKVRGARRLLEHLAHQPRQAPALGDFARTSTVVARGAANEQDARLRLGARLFFLRSLQPLARREPLDRKIVIGIGKLRPRLARHRRLAAFLVGFPRDHLDALQPRRLRRESRIGKGLEKALAEYLARQLGRRLAFSWYGRRGHRIGLHGGLEMREQTDQQNHRNRHADDPENDGAHDGILCWSQCRAGAWGRLQFIRTRTGSMQVWGG